jgi:hypothetical protein
MKQTSQPLGLILPQKYSHAADAREIEFFSSKNEQKMWSFNSVAISAANLSSFWKYVVCFFLNLSYL